jgi:hypothetical protein
MTRTMWLAVFCLVVLGASIAIRIAWPPASVFAETTPHQNKIGTGPVPNEAGKSDRLELPSIRAETNILPAAQPVSAENPSSEPETIKIPQQRWQDANAKIAPPEPPHRRPIAREPNPIAREPKKSAGNNPPTAKAEAWHCRQDAMGSLLRSLDLSPRCNL